MVSIGDEVAERFFKGLVVTDRAEISSSIRSPDGSRCEGKECLNTTMDSEVLINCMRVHCQSLIGLH